MVWTYGQLLCPFLSTPAVGLDQPAPSSSALTKSAPARIPVDQRVVIGGGCEAHPSGPIHGGGHEGRFQPPKLWNIHGHGNGVDADHADLNLIGRVLRRG